MSTVGDSRPSRAWARRHVASWLLGLMLSSCIGGTAGGQTPTNELWPELDVYWTPAKHQRTLLELSGSSEREAAKKEATVGLYQDYLQLPSGYLRAGYRFTFSTRDASYRESRLVAEVTERLAGKTAWRLVERSRAEFRWVNGAYNWRLRERLHLQRFFATPRRLDPRPYGTFEAYYYSQYNTIARLAGRAGVEVRLWPWLSSSGIQLGPFLPTWSKMARLRSLLH